MAGVEALECRFRKILMKEKSLHSSCDPPPPRPRRSPRDVPPPQSQKKKKRKNNDNMKLGSGGVEVRSGPG